MRSATLADEADVRSLLRRFDLPDEDIREHLHRFVLAVDDAGPVGVVGLEVNGHVGLLRSLAVAERRRNLGIAKALVAEIEHRASLCGVRELYLLTTTAEGFFSRLGFARRERAVVPDEIRATEEFRSLCPDRAVCMHRSLAEATDE